ncbi:hypothetical protein AXG93_977s1280 [Marchantia polymorpha subsp. ruderalis]|uniref:Uncharacterized protein n=1 Tax=Marchantia polymorpha subsp. ruderalis TaxID=1480154 RepID=A0A176WDV0_MARPO|nr:hypothetical protein AXG93_977s1280 [Marchantia polymorpha subsp. ruderalis]
MVMELLSLVATCRRDLLEIIIFRWKKIEMGKAKGGEGGEHVTERECKPHISGRGEDGKQNMREQEKKQTKTEPRADVGTWFHTARIKYAENRGTDAAEAKTRESSMKTWATSLAADRAAARAWAEATAAAAAATAAATVGFVPAADPATLRMRPERFSMMENFQMIALMGNETEGRQEGRNGRIETREQSREGGKEGRGRGCHRETRRR